MLESEHTCAADEQGTACVSHKVDGEEKYPVKDREGEMLKCRVDDGSLPKTPAGSG